MSATRIDAGAGAALYETQSGFTAPLPEDEFLHADAPAVDHTLSETSYLGFSVPEAGINCEIYHWFHPRFSLASGGVLISQGHHVRTPEAAYLDYRNFMPMPDQIADVRYETGVRVRVVEPLRELHTTFTSPDGSTSFDVTLRAIMPAAGRADGLHFVQAMHATGELVLHGERHVVDSYFTRDRSYGVPRSEVSHPVPPICWGGAVFGDDLAIHFVASPSDELSADTLRWGYVWRDGELRAPTEVRLVAGREADGITPTTVEVDLVDDRGDTYALRGTSLSRLPHGFWPNMVTHLSLLSWDLDGRTGHGELQDVLFGPYLRSVVTGREEGR